MEPYRVAAVLVAAVLAISLAYAAAQLGSGSRAGATATPAASFVGNGADAPEVRLGGRGPSGGSSSTGADAGGATLPRLLAEPRSSAQ